MPHWIPCCQLDLKRNMISQSFLKISPFTAGLGFPLAAHNPSSTLNMTHLTLGGDRQTEILFFPHPLYCFPISNNIWNCDISKLLSCWRPVCYSWLSLPITTIKYFFLPVTNINYPRNHPPQNLTSSLERPTSPWRGPVKPLPSIKQSNWKNVSSLFIGCYKSRQISRQKFWEWNNKKWCPTV